MDMEELKAKFQAAADDLVDAYKQMTMANALLMEVVERNQNFREYFFTSKKLAELAIFTEKRMLLVPLVTPDVDELFAHMTDMIQNVRNITATIMKEVDRLDT